MLPLAQNLARGRRRSLEHRPSGQLFCLRGCLDDLSGQYFCLRGCVEDLSGQYFCLRGCLDDLSGQYFCLRGCVEDLSGQYFCLRGCLDDLSGQYFCLLVAILRRPHRLRYRRGAAGLVPPQDREGHRLFLDHQAQEIPDGLVARERLASEGVEARRLGAVGDDAEFDEHLLEPDRERSLGTETEDVKSHTMKALYAPLKTLELRDTTVALEARLQEKLANVFKPDDRYMGRLVRRRKGQSQGWIAIQGSTGDINLTLNTRSGKPPIEVTAATWKTEAPSIFLPTREVLAMYEGFAAAYQDRELSFDETYYDACLALGRAALRGPRSEQAKALIAPIDAALGGKVTLKGSRFYLTRKDYDLEAHLVAEGLRKIASIAHLVLNGSLTQNGILFWDEPEANLNPRLVGLVVDLLLELGRRGVQIFVTTHDYLISNKLSLLSEYKKHPEVPIRFFSFHREKGGEEGGEARPGSSR
jgi:AAA domain, putative AbiEii toxin, Type IV TA system